MGKRGAVAVEAATEEGTPERTGQGEASGAGVHTIDEGLCQCPVCLEVMLGGIVSCPAGHGICKDTCFETLPAPRKCPQCRQVYSRPPCRNTMVEQIVSAATWSCQYGCGHRCTGGQMAKHRSECTRRPFKCLQPDCTETVSEATIFEHMVRVHKCAPFDGNGSKKGRICAVEWKNWTPDANKHFCGSSKLFCVGSTRDVFEARVCFGRHDKDLVLPLVHATGPSRRCDLILGSRENGHGNQISISLLTRPLRDFVERYWEKGEEERHFVFHNSAAHLLSVNGKVPVTIEVYAS